MPPDEEHRVEIHIDRLLAERGMTLTALAEQVGLTLANLSILKNGRARAIRFSTLTALCDAFDCQPADLFTVRSHPPPRSGGRGSRPAGFPSGRASS
jgi:putative transcriptional regulator